MFNGFLTPCDWRRRHHTATFNKTGINQVQQGVGACVDTKGSKAVVCSGTGGDFWEASTDQTTSVS